MTAIETTASKPRRARARTLAAALGGLSLAAVLALGVHTLTKPEPQMVAGGVSGCWSCDPW